MTPKRVLFVLNASGGGATQGIKEYLKFQRDVDAFLVLPSRPNAVQMQWISDYTKGFLICEMPWWNLPNGTPWFYKKMLKWKNEFRGDSGKKGAKKIADYIHENSIDFVYTGSILIREGAMAAKISGIKHFWHIKETFGNKGRVKFSYTDKEVQAFILKNSEKVICMTDYIKSFFNQVSLSPKLMVIHDAIDPQLFLNYEKDKRWAIRQKFGVAEDEVLIGMVSSLSSIWKNHEVFIKAASILSKERKFRFIAFGPEPKKFSNPIYNTGFHYFQRLKRQALTLGLKEKLIWAGFYDDIPAIFQGLDVFVHPCETEPFGRVVIEAMASGVPVIVPNAGGASEPVNELKIGWTFEPNSEIDLAKVIQEVVNDGNQRRLKENFEVLSKSTYTLYMYVKFMNRLFE